MINKKLESEIKFLDGPQDRWQELRFTLRTVLDYVKGFRTMHFAGPCICIFGSARFDENSPYYKDARAMGASIAKLGFTVLTGGGPGIMEAANRGAKDVKGRSVGINIALPFEQHENPYLDKSVTIKYFSVRKTLLLKYSYGFIVMPGGFGTMDELFEAITLIQTGKLKQFPIVIFDTVYYKNLIALIKDMITEKTISPEDEKLYLFTDDIQEATKYIEDNTKKFNLAYAKKYHLTHLLFEK